MRKSYSHETGDNTRSAKPGWTAIVFEMVSPVKDADGKLVPIDSVTLERGLFSAEIMDCAAGHGLMQKIGDDMAGLEKKAKEDGAIFDAKLGYSEYIKARIRDMMENFTAGFWVEESESGAGGGNITILIEAVKRALAAGGVDMTPEQTAGLIEKLKDETYRSSLRARPDVKEHMTRIVAERAAERASAAAKAAKAAAKDSGADVPALASLI